MDDQKKNEDRLEIYSVGGHLNYCHNGYEVLMKWCYQFSPTEVGILKNFGFTVHSYKDIRANEFIRRGEIISKGILKYISAYFKKEIMKNIIITKFNLFQTILEDPPI